MHPSPNISRTTIFDCEGKYELTKNGVQDELGVLIKKLYRPPKLGAKFPPMLCTSESSSKVSR